MFTKALHTGIITILFTGVISLFASNAQAKVNFPVRIECTPQVEFPESAFPPASIHKTNNLRRKTGLPTVAKGKVIHVFGRVMDEDCKPVQWAAVEMWQPNTFGRYKGDTGSDRPVDKNFLGAGRVYTDNSGQFDFITIYPGAMDADSSSYLNFRIKHDDMGSTNTRMYMPDDMNSGDSDLADLSPDDLSNITARKVKINGETAYIFDITLRGSYKNKRY